MYCESVVTKTWREGVARRAALTRWRFNRRVVRSAPPRTLTMSLMRDQPKVGGECHATASSTHTSEQPAEPFTLFEVQEIPPEEVTRNVLEASGKHLTEAPSSKRSKSQAANGKGPIAPTEGAPTLRMKPQSMKELCGACLGKDDRDFHAI
ncbi:hypothetical protein B296_00008081 [Ensete ventricosum]|uniref:Uncharacterized protein n=1 Tax=Ensete ventricosum TaxID=4639 RepID=A0A426Y4X4_ENSVE|nr:hypothetical protein B296_00008081 [Ensete ventricosum]